MKVQIQGQNLRWRVAEAELALLLGGSHVVDVSVLPGGLNWRRLIVLEAGADARLDISPDGWQLHLPRAAVAQLAENLPSREGLSFLLQLADGVPLALSFDVDVRDSRRQRRSPAVSEA